MLGRLCLAVAVIVTLPKVREKGAFRLCIRFDPSDLMEVLRTVRYRLSIPSLGLILGVESGGSASRTTASPARQSSLFDPRTRGGFPVAATRRGRGIAPSTARDALTRIGRGSRRTIPWSGISTWRT